MGVFPMEWRQINAVMAVLFVRGDAAAAVYRDLGAWWNFNGVTYFTQRAAKKAARVFVLSQLA